MTDATNVDLNLLMQQVQINSNGSSNETIDEIADALKKKLGMSDSSFDFRGLAKEFTKLSVKNSAQRNSPPPLSPANHAAFSANNGGIQKHKQRGRSPARSHNEKLRSTSAKSTPGMRLNSPGFAYNRRRDNQTANRFRGGEEKKDTEIRQRYDESPGASPTRPQQRHRSRSPMSHYSPPRNRPSTPVNDGAPGSRCSSPYASRPGLQEDDGDTLSLSSRSPIRSTTPMTAIPNVSSGLSSQHRPNPQRGHHRSRSSGVDSDVESISKPKPPRAANGSPMGRPASADQYGDRKPVPPRSFSRSPNDSSVGYVSADPNEQIKLPDLCIPEFDTQSGLSPGSETLFTPPPRASRDAQGSAVPMSTERFEDYTEPAKVDLGMRGPRPRPRRFSRKVAPAAPPGRVASPMDVDDPSSPPVAFHMGTSDPPLRRQRRNPPSDASYSSFNETPTATERAAETQANNPGMDYSGKASFIATKREEARAHYVARNFRNSILAYTDAIKAYRHDGTSSLPPDTLAVLLSNRAACLLMVGAHDAAIADCQNAIGFVSMPTEKGEPFSNDCGLLLKIKLQTRMARGYLKVGDYEAADRAFSDSVHTANQALAYSHEYHPKHMYDKNYQTLSTMIGEAEIGREEDSKRLREASEKLSHSLHASDRSKLFDALGYANVALSIANGSVQMAERKVALLVKLKRWREVAGFCERLAAMNVGLDGVFTEDLAPMNPFPAAGMTSSLKFDFFGGAMDEDSSTRELKLSSKSVSEAVLRLPSALLPTYVRSLRLEERYPACEAALRSLDEHLQRCVREGVVNVSAEKFAWMPFEAKKLERTKTGREEGDDLFRRQNFEKAAVKYSECLKIDGTSNTMLGLDDANAGGRLHAVLHCNRAACLMALRDFQGAIKECSNALFIHSRYMKAILRRARCHVRLQQNQEATSEYKRWMDLVEEAKRTDSVPGSPCLFDGPHDVRPSEVAQVQKELEDLRRSVRRAETKAREEADRRRKGTRDYFQDNFSTSWRSSAGTKAQERRDQWYNQQNNSRRWDSFRQRGPTSSSSTGHTRSSSNPRPHRPEHERGSRSSSQGPRRDFVSPRHDNSDHYEILKVARTATADEIKRSFRKLALKYHPDKNSEEGAADNFRRIKLAHEVLGDADKRRKYDADLRLRRHF